MKSNKTREKILDASLALFNEKKASNVSTVQISADMEISPGNLYYYFANKEEVIRCIWKERMLSEIEELYKSPEKIEKAEDLIKFMEGCFKHHEKFKFFYTEISTIFINDGKMKSIYEETATKQIRVLIEFFNRWIEEGHMREMTPAEKLGLADNCIIVSFNATSYCDLGHEGVKSYVRAAWFHVMALLSPFFTEKKKVNIAAELEKRGFAPKEYMKLRNITL